MIKQLSDIELISLYKKSKDPHIVGELYTRYTSFVFSICMKYLKNQTKSEDAVMQIFESMFQLLLIHNIETFKPWLYTVTKHYCFQILRSHAHTKEISIEHECFSEIRMENDDGNHLQEKIALEEKMLLFEQQLEGLSKEQRLCIELFYVKKKCYKEISNETGFNLNQVKSYIQNGKRNLQIRVIQT